MKIGDRVSWTHITRNGSAIIYRSWEGKITQLEESKAIVRRNGKDYSLNVSQLRLAEERSELTELILGKKS